MPNYSKTILVGHLCRSNELKYTQSNLAILKNAIAVTEKRGKGDDKKEETMFIDLTFFGKTAEAVDTYTTKGSAILIEGRLKLEQWEKDGIKHSKHSVSVDNVQFLGRKGEDGEKAAEPARTSKRSQAAAEAMDDDTIPFRHFEPWPE